MFVSTDDRSGGEWPDREVSLHAAPHQISDSEGISLLAVLLVIFAIPAALAYIAIHSAAEATSSYIESKAS